MSTFMLFRGLPGILYENYRKISGYHSHEYKDVFWDLTPVVT